MRQKTFEILKIPQPKREIKLLLDSVKSFDFSFLPTAKSYHSPADFKINTICSLAPRTHQAPVSVSCYQNNAIQPVIIAGKQGGYNLPVDFCTALFIFPRKYSHFKSIWKCWTRGNTLIIDGCINKPNPWGVKLVLFKNSLKFSRFPWPQIGLVYLAFAILFLQEKVFFRKT